MRSVDNKDKCDHTTFQLDNINGLYEIDQFRCLQETEIDVRISIANLMLHSFAGNFKYMIELLNFLYVYLI